MQELCVRTNQFKKNFGVILQPFQCTQNHCRDICFLYSNNASKTLETLSNFKCTCYVVSREEVYILSFWPYGNCIIVDATNDKRYFCHSGTFTALHQMWRFLLGPFHFQLIHVIVWNSWNALCIFQLNGCLLLWARGTINKVMGLCIASCIAPAFNLSDHLLEIARIFAE